MHQLLTRVNTRRWKNLFFHIKFWCENIVSTIEFLSCTYFIGPRQKTKSQHPNLCVVKRNIVFIEITIGLRQKRYLSSYGKYTLRALVPRKHLLSMKMCLVGSDVVYLPPVRMFESVWRRNICFSILRIEEKGKQESVALLNVWTYGSESENKPTFK